ncbi:hypothetical protein FRB93_007167 [Tulasnella sp. JGI-2019a]|nr:hypothetical protein FRB93_007167 [Tulasnella sp. JGI-2019a]
MASSMPLDVANFLGLMVALIMYGFYLVMFFGTIGDQWSRRKRSPIAVWVTICLFGTTTGNIALFIADDYNAWFNNQGVGVTNYFANTWTPIVPLRYLLIAMSGVAADVLICWRLFVIWTRNPRIVIFPAFFLCIEVVLAIFVCALSFVGYSSTGKYHNTYLSVSIIAGACTLITNVTCTALIVGRIWYARRKSLTRERRSLYKAVSIILVESGTLYTGTLLAWIIAILTPDGYGVYCFIEHILAMVMSIAPMLIILHLHRPAHSLELAENDVEFIIEHTLGVNSTPGFGLCWCRETRTSVPPGDGHDDPDAHSA